jgi:hypothetical protein
MAAFDSAVDSCDTDVLAATGADPAFDPIGGDAQIYRTHADAENIEALCHRMARAALTAA